MSTLTPEEVARLALSTNCFSYVKHSDIQAFATALEAALRAKWFAEPVAHLSTDPRLWDRSRIKRQETYTVPVYIAPQEES